MNYDEVAAAYLTPPAEPVDAPRVPTGDARRLRDAAEPIATVGWWARSAGERFDEMGLDFLGGYVWGRAAALGPDVAPEVVSAAFGVFEPGLVGTVMAGAKEVASRTEILRHRELGAAEGLRRATEGLDDELIASTGTRLLDALRSVDGTTRPLFSGLRSLDVPADPHGRLWRAAEMYREHRGDGHLAASVAAGLDPVEMNVLTELWLDYSVGEYSATRGFGPDRIQAAVASLRARGWVDGGVPDGGGPDAGGSGGEQSDHGALDVALTDEGRAARESIEHATDVGQHHVLAALGDGLESLVDDLTVVGDRVVAALAAPTDPRKRAAG